MVTKGQARAETQTTPAGSRHSGSTSSGLGYTEAVLAVGLSTAFVVLAVVLSPLVAAAVVVPVSIATGRWRTHTMPVHHPHSLSVPVYSLTAIVHAPRVSASSDDTSVTTAA